MSKILLPISKKEISTEIWGSASYSLLEKITGLSVFEEGGVESYKRSAKFISDLSAENRLLACNLCSLLCVSPPRWVIARLVSNGNGGTVTKKGKGSPDIDAMAELLPKHDDSNAAESRDDDEPDNLKALQKTYSNKRDEYGALKDVNLSSVFRIGLEIINLCMKRKKEDSPFVKRMRKRVKSGTLDTVTIPDVSDETDRIFWEKISRFQANKSIRKEHFTGTIQKIIEEESKTRSALLGKAMSIAH